MAFGDLSNELLLEIINWLTIATDDDWSGGSGKKALSHLALCSRHLNDLTTPILYRHVCQTGKQALPAFLRIILEKPELAKLVMIYEGSMADNLEENRLDMSGYSSNDLERCFTSITELSLSEAEAGDWMESVQAGDWHALTTLLLFKLPMLEEFDMTAYTGLDPACRHSVGSALESITSRQTSGDKSGSSLIHLRSVYVAYWDREIGLSFESILPFTSIPSVLDIHIHMLYGDDIEGFPELRSNARRLCVTYSAIEPPALTKFLRHFPHLRELKYEHVGSIAGTDNLLPQALRAGIRHLEPILRELTVSGTPYSDDDKEPPLAIGSLTEFENLKIIAMEEATMIGLRHGQEQLAHLWEILPRSLVTLKLSDCDPQILDEVRELFYRKHACVPTLKNLVIRLNGSWAGPHTYDVELAESLTKQYEEDGVCLEISPHSLTFF